MAIRESSRTVGVALDDAVAAILRWSSRSGTRRAMSPPESKPLSATDSWLLGRLDTLGPLRLSQLAEWQSVDKSTMTAQVRRLEQAGLVVRVPDPTDGRAALVSVSARGADLYAEARTRARQVFDELVAGWTTNDRETFAVLLDAFVIALADRFPGQDRSQPQG